MLKFELQCVFDLRFGESRAVQSWVCPIYRTNIFLLTFCNLDHLFQLFVYISLF